MEKDTRNIMIVIVAALVIISGSIGSIILMSGFTSPQTIVESQSMQHGIGSEIGIIDTGDMIIMKSIEKTEVITYVEGYDLGYSSFGMYGNVIIYDRGPNINPIIHRAILWLDYNGDSTWSAPSLENYPRDLWSCTNGTNIMNLSGTLTLNDMGHDGLMCTLNLDTLAQRAPVSGFITMGDNNRGFDQLTNISIGLISEERILSVAWLEIPWFGIIKMAMNGKMTIVDEQVPNSIPCMIMFFITIIFFIMGLFCLIDHIENKNYRKELRNLKDAPTPLFPVEPK